MQARRIAALALALLTLAALPAAATPPVPASPSAQRGLTVTGTASVRVRPDIVGFSFGAQANGATAQAALQASSAQMTKILAALKAAGIAADDLQTQQVSLSVRTGRDGTTIVGYTASNSAAATVRNLTKAGVVIDAAVAAGANQVSGPEFSRSDAEALVRQALTAAYDRAKAKAQALAARAGLRLGKPVAIQEGGIGPLPVGATAAATADHTPVEPGKMEIAATVTVTFAIA